MVSESPTGALGRQWQVVVGGHRIEVLGPPDEDELLDDPAVQARFESDEYLPYWGQLWPAAVMLAEYILADEPGDSRPALEVGCGLGLSAIAAKMAGWDILATDYDEDALRYTRINAQRNGFANLPVRLVDWRNPIGLSRYARIFASDVLYEARNRQPLANFISAFLAEEGVAIIADPNREAAMGFEATLSQAGLICRTSPTHANQPYGRYVKGTIYAIRRRVARSSRL